MEETIESYFLEILTGLEKGSLMCPKRRNNIVKYFNLIILGFAKVEEFDKHELYNLMVQKATKFHYRNREINGDTCMHGEYHNMLYISLKLCYNCQLKNSGTVANVLENIFECEKSFERIFCGGIYGVRGSQIMTGWRHDFANKKENIDAIKYFLEHANKSKCVFDVDGTMTRFVDVPLDRDEITTPAELCLQVAEPALFLLLMQYGATFSIQKQIGKSYALVDLLRLMNNFLNSGNAVPPRYLNCIEVALRAIPSSAQLYRAFRNQCPEQTIHPLIQNTVSSDFSPATMIPSLKHACRTVIRNTLKSNFLLPQGIHELQIPKSLQAYINLEQ